MRKTDDKEWLRERAIRVRELADQINDTEAAKRLREYAAELDAHARER
jgi:hypothetical protein